MSVEGVGGRMAVGVNELLVLAAGQPAEEFFLGNGSPGLLSGLQNGVGSVPIFEEVVGLRLDQRHVAEDVAVAELHPTRSTI